MSTRQKSFLILIVGLLLLSGCDLLNPPSDNDNTDPVANAGSDQNVTVGDTVQLDGSGSSDADGDSLTYNWSITSAPEGSTAVLSDAEIVNPTFVPNIAGNYTIQLIVNDGTENSDADTVTITVRLNISLLSTFDQIDGNAVNVAVYENTAFVSSWSDTLPVSIIDVSSSSEPALLSNYNTNDWACEIVVNGNYAYVVDGQGFYILNIADIENPVLTGSNLSTGSSWGVYDQAWAWGVCLKDDYAYITYNFLTEPPDPSDAGGLIIMNISDKANPTICGDYGTTVLSNRFDISGDYIYITNSSSEFLILDITDRENPVLSGLCSLPNEASDVKVSGNYAFVADGASGLQIVDITDKTSPFVTASVNTGEITNVEINGSYAYTGGASLNVIDITNPSDPFILGTYEVSGSGLDVINNYIYYLNGLNELLILQTE